MKRRNLLECLSDNIVIDKDKCTACGICVNTCVMDNLRLKLSPCRQACPLGVNCQGYVQLIARGEDEKAIEMLQEVLPFPGILGRICSHPCEEACHHRKIDGEAVAIKMLKRYLADQLVDSPIITTDMAVSSGKQVAVIGSGPAGMMAAYDLRVKGHGVTVFDAEKAPGGMLRWGIPEFRLPQAILERDIAMLEQMGVTFKSATAIGKDKSIEALKQEFGAIIVATGCPQHARLNLKEEDRPGVFHGLPFLRDARAGKKPEVGNKVVVIGGGNVAVDAAQTALRLGATDVTMVCLESENEVPAIGEALAGAKAEGIKLKCSWGNPSFSETNGVITGVEFVRCLNVVDGCGKFNPSFDSCELKAMDADTIIVAIGQRADTAFLEKTGLTQEKIREIDQLTLQTADEMIFMAGDVVTGPSSVIGAMAKGRCAAESAHRFLSGEHLSYGRAYPGPIETDYEIDTSRGNGIGRCAVPEKRYQGKGDFQELEMSLDKETARKEAGRCYSCGQPFGKFRTCWFCLPCEVECPNDALYVEIPYLLR
jgi:NADPH-dependent glutamate synthase beta subunit-like oxidoreductase